MRSGITLSMIADADTFISDPGLSYEIEYQPILDNGEITLVESGRYDIQAFINSHRENTDMSFIMARLAAGDASPLFARESMYADVSGIPFDRRAMLQSLLDTRNYFDKLPSDVRARFGNDFKIWIDSAGSKEWTDLMQFSTKSDPGTPGSMVDQSAAIADQPVKVQNEVK